MEWADRAWRIHGAVAGSIFQVRELSGELSMDATLTGESAFHRLEDSRLPKKGIKVWTLHQPGVPVVKGRLLLLP